MFEIKSSIKTVMCVNSFLEKTSVTLSILIKPHQNYFIILKLPVEIMRNIFKLFVNNITKCL